MAPSTPLEPLAGGLAEALACPDAHPNDADAGAGVEVLQTHLSWVFLTRHRVYKLRKAAQLGFVDFGTRRARNADCLQEVALNRRLAPDVYLGVAPVESIEPGGRNGPAFRIGEVSERLGAGGEGEVPEHCVVMRRLPDGCDALSRLAAGTFGAAHLDAVAQGLAAFHRESALTAPPGPEAWRAGLLAPVEENFRHLAGGVPGLAAERVEAVAAAARAGLVERAAHLEARRAAGRIVDGHGDLHLQHVWFEDGPRDPILIDCLEFDPALRRIDTASEVAFLAMDLVYRGRPGLAEHFLRRYAEEADDFDLYDVVDWFASYRAAVRAKVAALATRDPAIEPAQRAAAASSALRHFELAEAYLAPRAAGSLVLMCGSIGTGKSSVAAELARARDAVVISSDRTRKHLAGLAPENRTGSGAEQGLYDPRRTEAVYAALLERAEPVVRSGRSAVLDATYARREERQAAARWAAEHDLTAHLVEVRCDPERTRVRLAERQARGRGASDAGPELLEWSLARFEPPDEWERSRHFVVETSEAGGAGWVRTVERIAESLPEPWHRSCRPPQPESDPGG